MPKAKLDAGIRDFRHEAGQFGSAAVITLGLHSRVIQIRSKTSSEFRQEIERLQIGDLRAPQRFAQGNVRRVIPS